MKKDDQNFEPAQNCLRPELVAVTTYFKRHGRTQNGTVVLGKEFPYFDFTGDVLERDMVKRQLAVRPGQIVDRPRPFTFVGK